MRISFRHSSDSTHEIDNDMPTPMQIIAWRLTQGQVTDAQLDRVWNQRDRFDLHLLI